jgi:gentisate 1,2-dioxygenase
LERQLERRREPEPIVYDRYLEEHWQKRDSEKKYFAKLPRVLKYDETPWTQGAMAYHKVYSRLNLEPAENLSPLHSMAVLEQVMFPGKKSGRHRHYMEAIFYILEGEGYEVHDGIRYDWEPGDIMCVPTYCDHQHFNIYSEVGARLFYSIPKVFWLLGLYSIEQIELHQDYNIPENAQRIYGPNKKLAGYKTPEGLEFRYGVDEELSRVMEEQKAALGLEEDPRDTYEEYMKLTFDQTAWRRQCPHVVKAGDLPWEDTRMGRIKYLVHPKVPSGLLLYEAFVQEIPPGGRTGKHRHVSEEVHKILGGKGYDIQDGVRWDWEEEDVVCVPVNTAHQHFNADPDKPALFLSYQSRLYHFLGHGGYEHMEDAPEYKK